MYRFKEHTGDLEVEAEARTLQSLLKELGRAMIEAQISQLENFTCKEEEKTIEVCEEDLKFLIVSFLEEILYLEEAEGKQAKDIKEVRIDGNCVKARIILCNHPPSALIKAVTFHRLKVEKAETWKATVVFDI